MGSAKYATQNIEMATQKKSLKDLLKKPFQVLFKKEKKEKKEVPKNEKIEIAAKPEPIKVVSVTEILEDLKKIKIKSEDEDEFSNFTRKVIVDKRKPSEESAESRKALSDSQVSEDIFKGYQLLQNEGRRTKIDSQTSEDSGFAEKNETPDSEEEVAVVGRKSDCRKKRIQTVVISRGPIRNHNAAHSHPYRESDSRQINQVNKQTFSGGQVIVNDSTRTENTYLSQVLELVDTTVRDYRNEDYETYIDVADEFLNQNTCVNNTNFITPSTIPSIIEPTNTYPGPSYQNDDLMSNSNQLTELFSQCLQNPEFDTLNIYPTPPRSEIVSSPLSDTTAFYTCNSDYSLSPQTQLSSPMYNSDYEKCQDLSLEDLPSWVLDNASESTDNKPRQRIPSSSMTMKQYKDMQKDIANDFSKMECCQAKRKTCKELFEAHISKLKMEHRRMMCHNISNLELKNAYGVLQHIMVSLSSGNTEENLQLALFSLICEKVLSMQPDFFAQDFGFRLLKLAVLRCPEQPLLTRYLVQCIRTSIKTKTLEQRDCYFTEVDVLRDNLVIACARSGDAYAQVLYELVRPSGLGEQPLFNLHHANANGHNALHVACITHSAQSPRYHTVHVLLEHAQIDLWRKDVKGGETALHLAVNSANCDLKLIMIMFKHIDRKQWYDLAHAQNLSSISPLDYARSANKSKSENFPIEVFEFLKKCRKN